MINTKNKLKHKIMKAQFELREIGLYLDTHPNDKFALEHYIFYQQKCKDLNEEYERMYGCGFTPKIINGTWTWLDGDWPWEREANEI